MSQPERVPVPGPAIAVPRDPLLLAALKVMRPKQWTRAFESSDALVLVLDFGEVVFEGVLPSDLREGALTQALPMSSNSMLAMSLPSRATGTSPARGPRRTTGTLTAP